MDCVEDVQRSSNTFNAYVHPWTDMWEQRCVNVRQIIPDNARITSAAGIDHVWQQFNSWFYWEVNASESDILVAWNSEYCNLKWLRNGTANEDISFLKLSNGARNMLRRWWFREAYIKLITPPPWKIH